MDLIEKNDINANIVEKNTRCLQDAIFKHRCSCLPVWDFFYSIQKDNQEKRMTSMMRRMGEPSIKC